MRHEETDNGINGWILEDFSEQRDSALEGDDPWSAPPHHDEPVSVADFDDQLPADPSTIEKGTYQPPVASDDLDDTYELGDLEDGESFAELATLVEWNEGQPSGTSGVLADGPNDFQDEPEPLEEYNSELSQPVYDGDNTVTGLSSQLKINELIASIEQITQTQFEGITE